MSEKAKTPNVEQRTQNELSDVTSLSDEQLRAVRQLSVGYEKNDSETPIADLRPALGDIFDFKSIHDLNNIEIKELIQGATQEIDQRETTAKLAELKAIVSIAESAKDRGELRSQLSQLLGFKEVYEMSHYDLLSLVEDSQAELDRLTKTDEPGKTAAEATELIDNDKSEAVNEKGDGVIEDTKFSVGQIFAMNNLPNKDQEGEWAISKVFEKNGKIFYELRKIKLQPDGIQMITSGIPQDRFEKNWHAVEQKDDFDENPVEAELPKGRWQRVRERLHQEYSDLVEDFKALTGDTEGPLLLDDMEKQRKYRAIAALGVAAVGLGVYLTSKYGIPWIEGSKSSMPLGRPIPSHHTGGMPGGAPVHAGGESTKHASEFLDHTKGYEYPWSWAKEHWGNSAGGALHRLGDMARQDGHQVEWHGSGKHAWMSIDGRNNTQYVIKVLGKYAPGFKI